MVCNRCILVVSQEFERLGITPAHISLGHVDLDKDLSVKQLKSLEAGLRSKGFEILDDRKQQQIELIKSRIIEKVQSGEIDEHFSISAFLTKVLNKEYSYISRLFSEVESITVEQYFILQKIGKIKELLSYNEMNVSEIAYRLGYSSVAHLSAQFKKVTGLTPTYFKKLGSTTRKSLDNL